MWKIAIGLVSGGFTPPLSVDDAETIRSARQGLIVEKRLPRRQNNRPPAAIRQEPAAQPLHDAMRSLDLLRQCANALVRAANEASLLHEICRILVEVGGYRFAWIGYARQDDQKTVHPVAQAGHEEGYLEMVDLTWADTEQDRGPTGTAIRTGKASIVNDVLTDPHFAPWRHEAVARGVAAVLSLPLITNGQSLGALTIYAPEPNVFRPDEVALLVDLAGNLAYGIVALRTRAALRNRERQQAAVAELGRQALEGAGVPDLIDRAVVLVAQALDVEYAKVLELLPDREMLRLCAGVGWREGYVGHALVETGPGSQAGYTLLSREPVIAEDLRTETRFCAPPLLRDHGVISGVSVIIADRDRPFGILGAHTTRPRRFTEDDIHFVQATANVLSAAIARTRWEEDLRKSEEGLARAQQIAHLGNWDWNIATNELRWSDEIYRIFGLAPQDFGATYEAFLNSVHPDDREFVRTAVNQALHEKKLCSIDHRVVRGDGSVRVVHEQAEVVFDKTGRPVRMVGTVHDITERKQAEAEQELLLARERALALVGQALVSEFKLERVADVVMEQSLHVLHVDAVALFLADPVRQEITLLASRNFTPATVDVLRRVSYDTPLLCAQAARTGQLQVVEDLWGPEVPPMARQVYQREGVRSLLAVPLASRGRLVGVVIYGTRSIRHFARRDLDFNRAVADLFAVAIENARLFDEVREALKLREEFLSAAAHELKTPVTTIKGWAEVLLRRDTLTPRQERGLTKIVQQGGRIGSLIEDMLTIVRLRPGFQRPQCARFDLAALIQEQATKTASTTARHQFRVDVTEPLVVEADRRLLGEVLAHLLENAIRYSPEGGPIEVEARQTDRGAVVTVRDRGVGIPTERQPRVFEPFYEPVPPGARGYAGIVSLGLHVSKQIVDAHGGRIWLASEEGKGSAFSFSVPLHSRRCQTPSAEA